MNVLVIAASKHGSTMGIAEAIGETLTEQGLEASVAPVEEVRSINEYDAVVLGSAIYGGRWMKAAKEFVSANAEGLRSRPVWLFSSGPLGDPPSPEGDPVDAAEMVRATSARGHRVLPGKLDKRDLSLVERAMVRAVHAPEGDFRDEHQIHVWASDIAQDLHSAS
jgi:menaquinone-dependent protoporphyrinogen oxidase